MTALRQYCSNALLQQYLARCSNGCIACNIAATACCCNIAATDLQLQFAAILRQCPLLQYYKVLLQYCGNRGYCINASAYCFNIPTFSRCSHAFCRCGFGLWRLGAARLSVDLLFVALNLPPDSQPLPGTCWAPAWSLLPLRGCPAGPLYLQLTNAARRNVY